MKKRSGIAPAPPSRRGFRGESYFATTVIVPTILGWMEQMYL